MLLKGLLIFATAVVLLLAGTVTPGVTSDDYEGHQSSLRANVTMADGTTRVIRLEGVGCTVSVCSRVRAKETKAGSLWLDEIASLREISQNEDGSVQAVAIFKDGSRRATSIIDGNRILYVDGRSGRIERLDLSRLTQIDFQ
jgi:hypothetical protein